MSAPYLDLDGLFTRMDDLSSIAVNKGSSVIAFKNPIATSVASNVSAELSRIINVENFGATTASADCSAAFKAAGLAVSNAGGGVIHIGPGVWSTYEVPLYSNVQWVGSGIGVTILKQPNGANKDMVVSNNFATLTLTGPPSSAPINFSMSNLTVDGNYLNDYKLAATGGDTTVNNTAGYGFKIFGNQYKIDVELVNCAKIGFYSEFLTTIAESQSTYKEKLGADIKLTGRVFGQEAVYFRGPIYTYFRYIDIGQVGWLPTEAQRQSTIVASDLAPTYPLNVIYNEDITSGTGGSYKKYDPDVNVGFVRVYGNLSGLGWKLRQSDLILADTIRVENCRGGIDFGFMGGCVSNLYTNNIGNEPSTLGGTLTSYPDVEFAGAFGITLNIKSDRYPSTQASKLIMKAGGSCNHVTLHAMGYNAFGDTQAAAISSTSSTYNIRMYQCQADAVVVSNATSNVINFQTKRHTLSGSAVRRINTLDGSSQPTCRGNKFNIQVDEDAINVFHNDSVSTGAGADAVNITANLATGHTLFLGQAVDPAYGGVNINAQINNVPVTSKRSGSVALTDVTSEQVITVTHGFYKTPNPEQISLTLYDPAPTSSNVVEYCRLQSVSATQFTAVVKLSSVGTNGPLTLCWKMD